MDSQITNDKRPSKIHTINTRKTLFQQWHNKPLQKQEEQQNKS